VTTELFLYYFPFTKKNRTNQTRFFGWKVIARAHPGLEPGTCEYYTPNQRAVEKLSFSKVYFLAYFLNFNYILEILIGLYIDEGERVIQEDLDDSL